MYQRSFAVLAELAAEDLGPKTRARVEEQIGHNHYMTNAVEEARSHYLQAVASGHRPACRMPKFWKTIAGLVFEAGRFEEAAEYAEKWRTTNEAVHADFAHLHPLSPVELLLIAKYWSHLDRLRALSYVDMALAAAERSFDVPTLVWIRRLRNGEALAEVPPLERPWLAEPPLSLSAREVMRKVEIWQERRQLLTRPPPRPGPIGRGNVRDPIGWTSNSQRMTLDALMRPPVAAGSVAVVPQLPILPPPRTSDAVCRESPSRSGVPFARETDTEDCPEN